MLNHHMLLQIGKYDHYEYVMSGQLNSNYLKMIATPAGYPQAAGYQIPVYNGASFGLGNQGTLWFLMHLLFSVKY
jgi:hypothetical protein